MMMSNNNNNNLNLSNNNNDDNSFDSSSSSGWTWSGGSGGNNTNENRNNNNNIINDKQLFNNKIFNLNSHFNNSSLLIFSLNIRNLKTSIHLLQELLEQVNVDIICLQEIKRIKRNKLNDIFPNWNIISFELQSKYGGTMIMIRKCHKFKRIILFSKKTINHIYNEYMKQFEQEENNKIFTIDKILFERFSICKLFTNNNCYIIISLYQFTNNNDIKYIPHLYNVISSITNYFYGKFKIIIASDLNTFLDKNLDQSSTKNNHHRLASHLRKFYNSNNFLLDTFRSIHPHLKKFSFKTTSRIDAFINCDYCKVLECNITDLINLQTDHNLLYLYIDDNNLSSSNLCIKNSKCNNSFVNDLIRFKLPFIKCIPSVNVIDLDVFKTEVDKYFVKAVNDDYVKKNSISDSIYLLYYKISKAAHKSIKVQDDQPSTSTRKEINYLITRKERLYKHINNLKKERKLLLQRRNRKQTSKDSKESLSKDISALSKDIESNLKKYKSLNHNAIIAKDLFKNPDSIYNIMSDMYSSSNNLDKVVEKDKDDNVTIYMSEDKVKDKVFCYYKDMFKKSENNPDFSKFKIPIQWKQDGKKRKEKWKDYSKEISIDEVRNAIDNLENGKAADFYKLQGEHLKNLSENGIIYITKLMNKMFKSSKSKKCYFGSIFHHSSYVQLLPKSENQIDKYMVSQQRPITIIPIIAKLYSLILLKRTQNFVNQFQIISEEQHGFQENKNTVNCLTILRSLYENAKIDKKSIISTFIDFSKAYDSVNHKILGQILKYHNFPPILINNIMSTLSNNKIVCKTPYGFTDQINIHKGVKQGDVISPLLFNIFTTYISDNLNTSVFGYEMKGPIEDHPNINHIFYADDLVLITETEQTMKGAIKKLDKFSSHLQLNINFKKSKFITNRDNLKDIDFNINGQRIEFADENCYKYLGVKFHPNFLSTASFHQQYIEQKIMKKLNKLISINHIVPPILLVQAINTSILPIILYGSIIVKYHVNWIKHIQSIICKVVKRNLRLIRTAPNIALFCPQYAGGLGLKPIKENVEIQTIDSIHYCLNNYKDSFLKECMVQIILNQMAMSRCKEIIFNKDYNMKNSVTWPTSSSDYIKHLWRVLHKHKIKIKTNSNVFNLGSLSGQSIGIRRSSTYQAWYAAIRRKEKEKKDDNLSKRYNNFWKNKSMYNQNMYKNGKIKVYTDGSLIKQNNEIKIGYSIIPINQSIDLPFNESSYEYCSIPSNLLHEYSISSYTPELVAIYRAIRKCSKNKHIEIYTDSKSCIDRLTPLIENNQFDIVRGRNLTHRGLIRIIINFIKNLNLKVTLHHVKSHTGNYSHNDIADEFAKKAANQIDTFYSPHHKYVNMFQPDDFTFLNKDDDSIIDIKIRTHVKYNVFENLIKQWYKETDSFNKRIAKYVTMDKRSNIDFTKILTNKKRIRTILKARLNYLPTNSYLNKRYDNINPKCTLCKKGKEDVIHVFMKCEKLESMRIQLVNDIMHILYKNLNNEPITGLYKCWFMNGKFNPYTKEFYFKKKYKDEIIAGLMGAYTERVDELFDKWKIKDKNKLFRRCQLRLFKYLEECWITRCHLLFDR